MDLRHHVPLFLWLSYQGWLRADSLEELVGLDVSYHGGVNSGSNVGGVKKEYIDAFNKNKGTLRYRGRNRDNGSSTANVDSMGLQSEADDPEYSQEAAAMEALKDDPIPDDNY